MRKKFKKTMLFAVAILMHVCLSKLVAQTQDGTCGTDLYIQKTIGDHPDLKSNLDEYENIYRSYVLSLQNNTPFTRIKSLATNDVVTIPVIVHVFHNSGYAVGAGNNLSTAQIQSQIDNLNVAFANGYIGSGLAYNSIGQDTKIKFCLATLSADMVNYPTNSSEPGIMRYPFPNGDPMLNVDITNMNSLANDINTYTNFLTAFPPTKYLNIWLCPNLHFNNGSQVQALAGMGTFPFLSFGSFDGILMNPTCFGSNVLPPANYNLSTNLKQGKTLAHEVGHYLGLFHTFQDGCTNVMVDNDIASLYNGDLVQDTPSEPLNINGNPINVLNCNTNGTLATGNTPVSCSGGTTPNYQNFMGYSYDACRCMFTSGQKNRMRSYLSGYRYNLYTNENLIATGVKPGGCAPASLFAEFSMQGVHCINQTITLSAIHGPANTATLPSQFVYTVTGPLPSTAPIPAPVITNSSFNATFSVAIAGEYTVTLTVTNGTSVSQTQSITIAACNTCNPKQDANWCFGAMANLNFNSGTPQASDACYVNQGATQKRTIWSEEACISVSDAGGNL